jgi:hypothetical protein
MDGRPVEVVTPDDYDAAIVLMRDQRDTARHETEEARLVAREILAMDRLGGDLYRKVKGSLAYTFEPSPKWNELVAMARRVIG